MKYLTLLLIFFHLNNHFYFVVSIHVVKCIDLCSCDEKGIIICPAGIEVKFNTFHGSVSITCHKPQTDDLSVLTRLNISTSGYTRVSIEGCNLPDLSLFDLLYNISVRDFQVLYISLYNGRLQRKHFENLNKVEILYLGHNNLGVLPVDVFEGLINLNNLKLVSNFLSLPKCILQKNVKLEHVYLYQNNISQLSYDIFNSLKGPQSLYIVGDRNTHFVFDGSKNFNAPDLTALTLRSVRITTLSHFLQSKHRPSNLSLEDDTVTDFHKLIRELHQKTNIYDLHLSNNTAVSFQLQPATFADWSTLKYITVSFNNIESVPEDTFSRSKNIAKVSLSGNFITTFGDKIFSDLESLESLDVSKNRISHLPERMFARTKNLQTLDLSNNLLMYIEPNLFLHQSKLFNLNLSRNKLRSISGGQFSKLKSLISIDLSENYLLSLALDPLLGDYDHSVFYNCTELRGVTLNHNLLTEIYDDWRLPRTKLSSLFLSYNNITDIQIFNITYDMISKIKYDMMVPRKKVTKVDRKATYSIKYKSRAEDESQYYIDISNNPLNCDCDLLTSLYNISKYFSKETTSIDNAKCKTPKRFENINIVSIKNWSVEYERCKQLAPVKDQQCPEGCRCVYRPLTRSNVINCQYSDLQTYPRTLPVLPRANHTELNLYGNRLREFWMPDDPGYKNVTFLNLANNLLATLDISEVSKRLEKLDLRNNRLTTLSEETLELLENARELERLELAGNPWNSDVTNYRLAKLVRDKKHLIWHSVSCEHGYPIEQVIILYHSKRDRIIIYVVSSVVGTVILTVFILTVLYYRHRQKVLVYCFSSRWKVLRWLVSHPDLDDDDKLYDAFIVYAHEDEMFVSNHLVPYLEETEDRKYKLCLHYRDWIPGEQIMAQIGRSVRSSRRTIVVLSPNFLRSVWGVAEFRIAHAEALRDGTARVIVILYQDVSDEEVDEELKAYLQTNTYVKWGSPWFWRQLTYALPHPSDKERGVLHYFSRGRRSVEDLYEAEYHEMRQNNTG